MNKKFLLIILLLVGFGLITSAQKKKPAAVSGIMGVGTTEKENKNNTSGSKELRIISAEKVMEMKIPAGGANGAAVVYHPKEKLYYAAQAGNKEFPLIIFNKDGEIVSEESQSTLIDVRGLWYNPKTKDLEGNAFENFGWFSYDLNKKGLPEKINIKKPGKFQPDNNSAGILNTKDEEVLFLDGLNVVCYTTDGKDKRKSIQIHIGAMNSKEDQNKSIADFEKDYNTRSIIYTEIKGAEIGFLNIDKKQVELYSIESGYMSQIIKLPVDFKPESYFNFSYSNEIFWLFDKESRKWKGYK